MRLAAEGAPDLVEHAAARRADEAPRERAHERGHVVRQRHELLEGGAPRHVRPRQDPAHHEAEDDRHDRRHDRHEDGVPEDVGVPPEVDEIVEAIRLRRARLRIADAQRGLEEKEDRIQDEDGGGASDEKADESRPGQPDRARQETPHRHALRGP